jgi:hypothetical protein
MFFTTKDVYPQRRDAIKSGRALPMFQNNLLLASSSLKMEAAGYSEMLVTTYQITLNSTANGKTVIQTEKITLFSGNDAEQ